MLFGLLVTVLLIDLYALWVKSEILLPHPKHEWICGGRGCPLELFPPCFANYKFNMADEDHIFLDRAN